MMRMLRRVLAMVVALMLGAAGLLVSVRAEDWLTTRGAADRRGRRSLRRSPAGEGGGPGGAGGGRRHAGPPADARPGRPDSDGGRGAGVRRCDRPRQAGQARRSPDGVARVRAAPGRRVRCAADDRGQGEPPRVPRPRLRRGPHLGRGLPRRCSWPTRRSRTARGRPSSSRRGPRTSTGSPATSARSSSASTSVAPSATTTRGSRTGSRTTSTG